MFVPNSRAAGVLIGCLADQLVADPQRGHPVAGFGTAASALERVSYRDSRTAGAAHCALLLLPLAAAAGLVGRSTPAVAAATWISLGGTSLARIGSLMADLLDRDDIHGARALLPSLCGRDPVCLDRSGLARAALESIAENTSDAQVAPLVWAAVGGAPGVLLYRGINTLDAMIGHRSPRYLRFGWAAARLDDMANFAGARLAGALTVLCAPLVGGSAAGAAWAWLRDAAAHPSPNAGAVEAAFAGALGVTLGGPTQYRHELEIRPSLGDGPPPTVADLRRAVRLSRIVSGAAAGMAVAAVLVAGRLQRRRP